METHRHMKTRLLLVLAAWVLLYPSASAQAQSQFSDDLVDHMAGAWKLEGPLLGHEAHHEIQAEWVLNHQFLRIHEKTSAGAPNSEHPYEAVWFLGYDSTSDRYVLHLMDIFGARFSETLGYGIRDGNQLRFVFEYPDGPFHSTYRWDPQKGTWEWHMEQKDKNGKWSPFADLTLTKAPTP